MFKRNLLGKKFGRLTVLEDTGERYNQKLVIWKCKCDCGEYKNVSSNSLLTGGTKSCGCLQKERTKESSKKKIKHGHKKSNQITPTYSTWQSMKRRCLNEDNHNFKYYGGRVIMICERWMVFENFLADMGERPEGKTLDRINNDGHYEPSNCKWSTSKEQANNRSNKNV